MPYGSKTSFTWIQIYMIHLCFLLLCMTFTIFGVVLHNNLYHQ
jgi:hypothetical protein